jgi:hypothetical protein
MAPGSKPDNGGLFGTDCGHNRRNVRHPFIDNYGVPGLRDHPTYRSDRQGIV